MKMRYLKLFLIGASVLALSGCSWGHHGYGPPAVGVSVVYVHKTPPPPLRIAIPPRPVSGAVWIDGHWRWTGVEFVWVDGYWMQNPPRGKVWAPGRWTETRRGWYWTPGRWN